MKPLEAPLEAAPSKPEQVKLERAEAGRVDPDQPASARQEPGQEKVTAKALKAIKRQRADNEFLPAALEILETPASPIRTAFIWFICILATSALVWSYFGTFDIVATAQGKVQPAGRVKMVQSIELGRTKTVQVTNGSQVKAGDMLVALDDTEIKSEETAFAVSLQAFRAEVTRREAVLATVTEWQERGIWNIGRITERPLAFPDGISEPIRRREQLIYRADTSQLHSSLANLDATRRQRQTEIDSLTRTIAAQTALVKTLTERVSMRTELIPTAAGSRAQVIDALQSQQEAEASLVTQTGQLAAARAALEVAVSEAAKLVGSFLSDNVQKQSEAARRVDELEQQLIKASKRRSSMTILSPIDGTVQASAVTTIGQVVTAGSELMRIVPENAALEIEAYLPNRDIGFVRGGQTAVIKVEAFPFTRYGIIEGKVTRVATDAIPEPDAQALEGAAAKELQSIIPTGNAQRMQNLVFPVTIRPDVTIINVDGKPMPLSPGMSVTVEVKTGKRRILEYLFSPLAEISSQAMQER
ncbi:HlyD family type I secretion periplasmic adaptor subunit [Phyllobacterium sp. 22229]|uniref:Membrane fusion protein (MFP) family protein n=1 Tax=Phyllobacterium myrsinacearum TaxID=28101 RepID=A0A2S9JB25_9HYPH|nr:HlyD family type I secretion periplasmic adaptor subunit [Phyllobacterium myrsinacearum]PRD49959.1 HlyD family type I secretion periplasmic adaptor subunit [Phyllobacterium myrsinacearum]PWV86543.1 HlyD family type I secretion membrane fusion protein [Phyllobacterium myrsinacearum]RZU96894.1 hemolysin D [Phyllobacterium myrsinacearum]